MDKRKSFARAAILGPSGTRAGGRSARACCIVGLAPAAHGANRTGRVFTGDRSGDLLYRARCTGPGCANQALCVDAADGLELTDATGGGGGALRAAGQRADAGRAGRPARRGCDAEWRLVGADVRVIVALGGFAWRAALRMLRRSGTVEAAPEVRPRCDVALPRSGRSSLLGCYHPSQQNTFTGRLTAAMLDDVFATARRPGARGGNRRTGQGVDTVMRLSVLDLVPVRTDQSTVGCAGGDDAAGADRRPARLHPLLARRAPQHARGRRHQPAGADRLPGRADRRSCGSGPAG